MKSAVSLLAAMTYLGLAQAAPVPGQGTWETTLKARDIQFNAVALEDARAVFFYDQMLDITWLRNWNTRGAMTWNQAVAWTDAFVIGGLGGWRLPNRSPLIPDSFGIWANNGSTNVGTAKTGIGWGTTSELGHMYYVTLGNKGYCVPNDAAPASCEVQTGFGPSNTAYFDNVRSSYWNRLPQAPTIPDDFFFNYGENSIYGWAGVDDISLWAVPVRSGDVLGAVPEPQTEALLLAGLAVLSVLARRSKPGQSSASDLDRRNSGSNAR